MLSLFILSAGFFATDSLAQSRNKASTEEDVAIAFYKTGGFVPNFNRWITEQAPYIHTPQSMRPALYNDELERLQIAYGKFDPLKTDIIVKTSSMMQLSEHVDLEGNHTYFFKTKFTKAPSSDVTYFPYAFMHENIAIFPFGAEKFQENEISKEQYDFMKENSNNRESLTTIIRMRAYESDFSEPKMIGKAEQWVFKTKIASIELWNKYDILLWEYTAPWYTSPNMIDMQNLYKARSEDKIKTAPIL